jgi:hypothetical protein
MKHRGAKWCETEEKSNKKKEEVKKKKRKRVGKKQN